MAPERSRADTPSHARRGPKQELREVSFGPDLSVIALAAAGFAVAGYLTWLKWSGSGVALCVAGSGCDIVQASRYSRFLGVPTALWGALVYAAIAVLAALGLTAKRWLGAFVLAAGGVGFSAYMTFLSLFVIGATCIYCVSSGMILVALLTLLLWRRPLVPGRRSAFQPMRLATYGTLAGIGAIVFGAFVYAAPSSVPTDYQLALARHLREVGAIMYGAYW
jgi:uncharacterized membrane protein